MLPSRTQSVLEKRLNNNVSFYEKKHSLNLTLLNILEFQKR